MQALCAGAWGRAHHGKVADFRYMFRTGNPSNATLTSCMCPHRPVAGCIQVSNLTRELLDNHSFTPTGGVDIKGKGRMETFIWDPEEHPVEQYMNVQDQTREAAALISHISKRLPLPLDILQAASASQSSSAGGEPRPLHDPVQRSAGTSHASIEQLLGGPAMDWMAKLIEMRASNASSSCDGDASLARLAEMRTSNASGSSPADFLATAGAAPVAGAAATRHALHTRMMQTANTANASVGPSSVASLLMSSDWDRRMLEHSHGAGPIHPTELGSSGCRNSSAGVEANQPSLDAGQNQPADCLKSSHTSPIGSGHTGRSQQSGPQQPPTQIT